MSVRNRLAAGAVMLASALSGISAASAQPLSVTVNPLASVLAFPQAVLAAPFAILTPPPAGAYDPAVAEAAAVSYTPAGLAVVPAPVLHQAGPRYDNPASSNMREAIVLRPGSIVPSYVPTEPVENISVAGLTPGGMYEYFISPERHVVYLDTYSRRVVRVTR